MNPRQFLDPYTVTRQQQKESERKRRDKPIPTLITGSITDLQCALATPNQELDSNFITGCYTRTIRDGVTAYDTSLCFSFPHDNSAVIKLTFYTRGSILYYRPVVYTPATMNVGMEMTYGKSVRESREFADEVEHILTLTLAHNTSDKIDGMMRILVSTPPPHQ